MSLMRTKPVDANANTGLKRCLTAFDLTLLGIGCIIGTGIFVLSGVAAAQHAGPAIVLSFILSGTACGFAALCYAELASAVGGCGSAYGYAYAGIGEFVAWIIGWLLILEYAVATAVVSIGWSGYFASILDGFFGITMSAALAASATTEESTRRWVRSPVFDWDFDDLPDHITLPSGARAYPALQVKDRQVSLGLLESGQAAADAHALGVRALLLARLGDRLRDLARTAKARLGLAQIGLALHPDELAHAIAERAASHAWKLDGIRTQAAFQQALQHRGEFGRLAAGMLDEVCVWLVAAADLRKRVRALGTQWPEARTDLTTQLNTLLAPGFVDAIPDPQWPRVSVYLKACSIRLDRLPNKPQRDLELTDQLKPWIGRLSTPQHPARWVIEEWRVALFAQELRAEGAPSAAKVKVALRG